MVRISGLGRKILWVSSVALSAVLISASMPYLSSLFSHRWAEQTLAKQDARVAAFVGDSAFRDQGISYLFPIIGPTTWTAIARVDAKHLVIVQLQLERIWRPWSMRWSIKSNRIYVSRSDDLDNHLGDLGNAAGFQQKIPSVAWERGEHVKDGVGIFIQYYND
jgi:hypothetical protein